MNAPRTLLKLNASARYEGSRSRALVDELVARLIDAETRVIERDLAVDAPAFVSEPWIQANFTAKDARTDAQRAVLAESDALVAELKAADAVVIGAPIYNFGVPAALKAWVDQVARARETFRYGENGPVGLLEGTTAYVVITSGGTEAGSATDFASGYLRHVLGFMGIQDVRFLAADQLVTKGEAKVAAALERLDALAA